MSFYEVRSRALKSGVTEIYPEFLVRNSNDLLVQGGAFLAVWDESKGLWCTDELDVARIVDTAMSKYREDLQGRLNGSISIRDMMSYSSRSWTEYKGWVKTLPDTGVSLDQKIFFASDTPRREDYASTKASYDLSSAPCPAWDRMMDVLYAPEERRKIEWAIGAIFTGDSRRIQKFMVLYGDKGTGKSTVIKVIEWLFDGYCKTFDAKALGSANQQFSTAAFKSNPLVAIQHDGNLSRIEDNTLLNSITSHEVMTINEKHKAQYDKVINSFLIVGSNSPVKITDSKSGIIRRLIDVTPTGNLLGIHEYETTLADIRLELGAIASHCIDVYRSLGRNYYRDYVPISMMRKTDIFYNFVEDHAYEFKESDYVTLTRAWTLYSEWVENSGMDKRIPRHVFREQLKDYFNVFVERTYVNGERMRQVYSGFRVEKFDQGRLEAEPEKPYSLVLDQTTSLIDSDLSECPAQYANNSGTPAQSWDAVSTVLADLDTTRTHYVRVPLNHIVIDFDLRDETGEKSKEKNIEAAQKWPPTYAEISKGGNGVHLHYTYDGDPSELAPVYDEGIEIKVFGGKSSLRRRVSLCNDLPVAHIDIPLPRKEPKRVINKSAVVTESSLRSTIEKALRKEVHPDTSSSVDFIKKVLDDAYASGVAYSVEDLRGKVMAFALSSTNQSSRCLGQYAKMQFTSEGSTPDAADLKDSGFPSGKKKVYFDLEVYPNLFVVCWKQKGSTNVTRMVNPDPESIEPLLDMPLVGFNNRKYDNHILYARWMGADNRQLFDLSQRIIGGDKASFFPAAYGISLYDLYDVATKKQSLKKWMIELGVNKVEMDIPWDQPVSEEDIDRVVDYCANDVNGTEKVDEHIEADVAARKILAKISGLSINSTTNTHTQQIIFGKDRKPPFKWTDLWELFPGYKYSYGKSTYKGFDVGEGGFVYAEPGMYYNVALLDVASMHPASLIALNCFGKYTDRFKALRDARIMVKHGDRDGLKTVLGGALLDFYSEDKHERDMLAYALKIAINSVYGMTAASFPNRCNGMDPSLNPDNIVAKRGALFMIDLLEMVQSRGFQVVHIKTDSIKIPNATPEIIREISEFGKRYGYEFEHETTYDRMCLVNDAVYIAHDKDGWHAVGKQFQHPVVFKTLFSKEPLEIKDYFETRSVKTSLHIQYPDSIRYVGKVGEFVPVISGGGTIVRKNGEDYNAATGTKGHQWELATDFVDADNIDKTYADRLVGEARSAISQFGDVDRFREVV